MEHHAPKSVSRGLAALGMALCAALPAALSSSPALAQAGTSLATFDNICLNEARRAEAQHGIPSGLLQSITRVEAGRKTVTGEFMPWAWTLNDRGEGLFFDSREAAMKHLQAAVDSGDHSVDVGCMQVNTKWHMEGFLELADMLDPVQNADYAAGFLLDLHEAHQSWDDAVKHYHSAVPEKNIRYHSRVLAELESFLAASVTETADDPGQDAGSAPAALELASMTASPELSAEMPAPPTPPIPPLPLPMPAPLPLDQPVAQPLAQPLDRTGQGSPLTVTAVPSTREPVVIAPAMAKQPNLAPHWDRVEQFRRLLARDAG